jgi:RNA polymerase sigma factor (TIGR02999 family)
MRDTMSDDGPGDVTQLLHEAAQGSEDAARRLMPLVYAELRALAGSYMKDERRASTLQPTALVNEAFVRLLAGAPMEITSRTHFFALAARAMRHVLVDAARERAAAKRGAGAVHVTLDDAVPATHAAGADPEVLAVHEALEKLATLHERQARVVELRYFGGLTIEEIAALLGVSTVTIDNDWAAARAWLFRRLSSA